MKMPTTEQTLDEVLNLAAAHFKVPREKLSPDDDFFRALGIDSLQTLDLLTKLENHFRVELPDYETRRATHSRTRGGRTQGWRSCRRASPVAPRSSAHRT